MRMLRVVTEGWSYYNCINRVMERRFLLDDDERERFRMLLRRVESFTGVKVLTHAIMRTVQQPWMPCLPASST